MSPFLRSGLISIFALAGCTVCAIDVGCEPQPCAVPGWIFYPGSYSIDSASIYSNECASTDDPGDLIGRTLQVLEREAVRTEVDGNPQTVAIDGDSRYAVRSLYVKCGVADGMSENLALAGGGCSWSARRVANLRAQSQDRWQLQVTDDRTAPVGACWMGPATCRFSTLLSLRRLAR